MSRASHCSTDQWHARHGLAAAALLGALLSPPPAFAVACIPDSLFTGPSEPTVGGPQRAVKVADLNADGVPDFVFSLARSVEVHLGDRGTGELQLGAGTAYATNFDPQGVAIADLDGDTQLDLAVACDGGGVYIFKGAGDGTFTPAGSYNIGSVWDIAAADVNADGILDLVTTHRNGSLLVLLGSGSDGVPEGVFQFPREYRSIGSPKGLLLRDLNGDGALDAVVATQQSFLALHLGIPGPVGPTGAFGLATPIPLPSSESYDVVAADFNFDGRIDLACTDYSQASVTVCLQLAPLAFTGVVRHSVGGQPLGLAAVDVNHDLTPDLVAGTGLGAGCMTLLLNQGSGSASWDQLGRPVRFGPPRLVTSVVSTDLDGDQISDLVATNVSTSAPLLFLNQCPSALLMLDVTVGEGGTVSRSPDKLTYALGDTVTLTATPRPTFRFGGWRGDATGTGSTIQVVMDRTRFITAEFPPITHNLHVTVEGSGQVRRTPDTGVFHEGSDAGLRALPSIGYLFTGWSGDVTTPLDSLVLLMDRDHSVAATFIADPLVTPHILSVTDVPNDQGGFVKLRWSASVFEFVPQDSGVAVNRYWIWRELPQSVAENTARAGAPSPHRHVTHAGGRSFAWEFVTAMPVGGFDTYSAAVRTGGDSLPSGNPYTRFLVQARDVTGTRFWDSPPDSGYSVDDLGPHAAANFSAVLANGEARLHWRASPDADVSEYHIHRGADAVFVPAPGNLLATTSDTLYVDHAPSGSFYKLVPVDVHGNTGTPSLAVLTGEALLLEGVQPNPSSGIHCMVQLTLPDDRPARLMLLDVNGRRVRESRLQRAGRQSVDMALGRRLPPGLYWVRLEHGASSLTRRVAIVD